MFDYRARYEIQLQVSVNFLRVMQFVHELIYCYHDCQMSVVNLCTICVHISEAISNIGIMYMAIQNVSVIQLFENIILDSKHLLH